jgi:TubC N-terminal docking domain
VSAAVEILWELQRRGVSIRAEGDALKLKPRGALDNPLIERVREHKPEILATLRNRPGTCAASCYEVEPGRWIHHPWDNCKTIPSALAGRAAERECRHCDSVGECSCPACTLRRTEKPVPCLMCHPVDRQVWLAATRPKKERTQWIH